MRTLRELLESLVDGGDCHFDHHGGCQAHGYLSLEPGEACPQAELKALLAAGAVPDTGQARPMCPVHQVPGPDGAPIATPSFGCLDCGRWAS